MSTRETTETPARRPGCRGQCVVVVCQTTGEADAIGDALARLNVGGLVVYRSMGDLLSAAPAGRVALSVLDLDCTREQLTQSLRWLQRRWPRRPVVVVAATGGGEHELAARQGGALFLTRPVGDEQWSALLSHLLATGEGARVAR